MRRVGFVLLFAASFAWSDQPPEPEGFWTGPLNAPTPATIAGGVVIDARQLASLMKSADALVIDVSNAPNKPAGLSPDAPWMPLPQEVIPGSDWLPGVGMGVITAQAERSFQDYLAEKTRGKLDHPIVIYCHENCWLSWNAAKRAIGYGYRRVYWLPAGIEGWRAAGYTTVVAKPRAAPNPATAESSAQ